VNVRSAAETAQRDEAHRRNARDAATRQKIRRSAKAQSGAVVSSTTENVVAFAMFLGHSQTGIRDLCWRRCDVGGTIQFR